MFLAPLPTVWKLMKSGDTPPSPHITVLLKNTKSAIPKQPVLRYRNWPGFYPVMGCYFGDLTLFGSVSSRLSLSSLEQGLAAGLLLPKNFTAAFALEGSSQTPPRLGTIYAMDGDILRPAQALRHTGSGPRVTWPHTVNAILRHLPQRLCNLHLVRALRVHSSRVVKIGLPRQSITQRYLRTSNNLRSLQGWSGGPWTTWAVGIHPYCFEVKTPNWEELNRGFRRVVSSPLYCLTSTSRNSPNHQREFPWPRTLMTARYWRRAMESMACAQK